MKISYIKDALHSITGTKMCQYDLTEILDICTKMPINAEKGSKGAIFPYIKDTLGIDDSVESDGLVFIDIDNITKETADIIYNNFELLADDMWYLYAIQKSASYYISPEKKCGLHIFARSSKLNRNEYKIDSALIFALLCYYIKKKLDIDLRQSQINNQQIIDTHNCNLSQRFNLFYSDYKLNDIYSEPFDPTTISKENINILAQIYPDLGKYFNSGKNTTFIGKKIKNVEFINNAVGKIKIDRFFEVDGYSGNELRWRINYIAYYYLGDNAKDWCDKYFYYENNKSIYTPPRKTIDEKYLSRKVLNWLVANKYLYINNAQYIIKRGEYIEKYRNEIIEFINNNKVTQIIADTGVGKTTFINGNERDDIDFVFGYRRSLAEIYNAVVIVPYNATNNLYSNCIEISSNTNNKIVNSKPLVMIWDKALLYWEEIKDRTFIIDESHLLFLDQNYRDSAVELMIRLKENNNKIILFSATPTGEVEELGAEVLNINSEKDDINVEFIECDNICWSQYNYIKSALENKWFDRVVLFDDCNAKKIWEKLYVEGVWTDKIAYIRSETKNSEDFIKLKNDEILYKDLTICTCIAFNGLNFKNKNERILVVSSFIEGNTTAQIIIQEIGRIRNSKVTCKIFFGNSPEQRSVEELIDKAEILSGAAIELEVPDTVLNYNRRLLDSNVQQAVKKVEKWIKNNAKFNNVVDGLCNTGYINVKIKNLEEKNDKILRFILAKKKQESDLFKEDVINSDYKDKIYDDNSYMAGWKKRLEHILNNDSYIGVDYNFFIKLLQNQNKKTNIDTTLNKLTKIISISLLSEEQWNKYISTVDIVIERLTNIIDKRQYKTDLKNNSKIRELYKGKIKESDGVYDLSDVVNDVIEFEIENYNKEREAKSNSGKIGGKTGGKIGKKCVITEKIKDSRIDMLKKYKLTVGQEFESVSKLSEYTGISASKLTIWRQKEWII